MNIALGSQESMIQRAEARDISHGATNCLEHTASSEHIRQYLFQSTKSILRDNEA